MAEEPPQIWSLAGGSHKALRINFILETIFYFLLQIALQSLVSQFRHRLPFVLLSDGS